MGVRASVALEIVPQVRALLAEGEPRNAAAIARKLGIYSPTPVYKALQRLAA
jgi:DNA-binding GntR family transcriptional regulator